ncbi:amino acid transporter AVT1B-like [Dioscorea cayenensis subsp. rotundata]|uniref:Amino acid transporter AVT1B-like n=1 Tax=Dioscorea cayennensis subsp. rotundata TaxID=55577 RepID=A0AB40CYR2_DIOCR|nr:amino acid transporter AVT1B-like [Dioscorea cayenensis subsp. rotundata]
MKTDEEMGLDRGGVELETDDEENQARQDNTDYSPSSSSSAFSTTTTTSSPRLCEPSDDGDHESSTFIWPQSYRQSIDMMSNVSVSVQSPNLVGSVLRGGSSWLSNSFARPGSVFRGGSSLVGSPFARTDEASLDKPLIRPQIPYPDQHYLPAPPDCRTPIDNAVVRKPSFKELPPSPECSTAQAIVNGLNVLCGVGLLTTPYAVKEGGWLGMLLLLGFGSISFYTGILLKRCLDSSPELQTYPDIGQAAFGRTGRLCISVILYLELYACCVEYIILVGDSLSSMFPNAHLNYLGFVLNSQQLFAITTAFLVLPTVWLRDLSLLSYLSAGGVTASVIAVLCLLWVGTVDKVGFHPGGTPLDLANLPVALGLYGFCFSGHSVFPNIYSSMRTPSEFPSVMFYCFLICTIVYSGVAVLGYMMFGEFTKSQFTLNLPPEFVASKLAIGTTVVNPLSKYALTMTPVALSLEEILPSNHQSRPVVLVIRTLLVLSTLIVALKVPYFGFVMALLGSIFTMLVALILPCACYLSIQRRSTNYLQVSLCVWIILVGVACSCIGSYSSIKQILSKAN